MPRRRKTSLLEDLVFLILSPVIKQKQAENSLMALKFRQFVDVSPTEFEVAVGELFKRNGFEVSHSGQSGDGGVDLEMSKAGLKYIAQCKRYTNQPIGEPTVRDFYGALVHRRVDHGYLVTTSRFTQPALTFAQNKPITLVGADEIKTWLSKLDTQERTHNSKPHLKTAKMPVWQVLTLIALGFLAVISLCVLVVFLLSTISAIQDRTIVTQKAPTSIITKTSELSSSQLTAEPTLPVVTNNGLEWHEVNIDLYGVSLKLPTNWGLQEVNRRPEPETAIDPKRGHDCAEYIVTTNDGSGKLFIRPACGFAEGTGRPLPYNAVIVDQKGDNFVIRYFDEQKSSFYYSKGGYVTISDTSGTRSELYISSPPVLMFGDSFTEFEVRFHGISDDKINKLLTILDEIILSIKSK